MGLLEKLRQLIPHLRRSKTAEEKELVEALESPIQSIQSPIQNDSIDSIAEAKTEEKPSETPVVAASKFYVAQLDQKPEPMLDKESFQIGLAAGYTGRSIKEIEQSLARIESQMVTKDWFNVGFEDLTPKLIEILKSIQKNLEDHDLGTQKRFEAIQAILGRMETTAKEYPEPLKDDVLREIRAIEAQFPLSPKMKELVDVVKSAGEVDYGALAKRLEISVPALRGLLSNILKRTNEIERFKRSGKGWVRVKAPLKNDSID